MTKSTYFTLVDRLNRCLEYLQEVGFWELLKGTDELFFAEKERVRIEYFDLCERLGLSGREAAERLFNDLWAIYNAPWGEYSHLS